MGYLYRFIEWLLIPVAFIHTLIEDFKYKFYHWGMSSKPDPLWEYYELRTPEEKYPEMFINKKTDLVFVKQKNNKKKKVYELLQSNPDGIEKRKILNKVKIKYDDLRSIISQLRDDLDDRGINRKIVIEEQGIYKLTNLS